MQLSITEENAIEFYNENLSYVEGFGLFNLEREDRRLFNLGKKLAEKVIQFNKNASRHVSWTPEEYDAMAAAYVKHSGDRPAILKEFRLFSERHTDSAIDIAAQSCRQLDLTIQNVSGLTDYANGLLSALQSIDKNRFSGTR
jgi:hypothetical protein|tara:strand:- start:50 stop:475 length:426 start_codon:yes stop_codon:yes gene_type:complete